MIGSHKLKMRKSYLDKLIGFQDTEPVKIITGIRRCGKSSLLKLMAEHLRDTGVLPEQIIEMNFESHDFRSMTDHWNAPPRIVWHKLHEKSSLCYQQHKL